MTTKTVEIDEMNQFVFIRVVSLRFQLSEDPQDFYPVGSSFMQMSTGPKADSSPFLFPSVT